MTPGTNTSVSELPNHTVFALCHLALVTLTAESFIDQLVKVRVPSESETII